MYMNFTIPFLQEQQLQLKKHIHINSKQKRHFFVALIRAMDFMKMAGVSAIKVAQILESTYHGIRRWLSQARVTHTRLLPKHHHW